MGDKKFRMTMQEVPVRLQIGSNEPTIIGMLEAGVDTPVASIVGLLREAANYMETLPEALEEKMQG
jgi:hypothetical protein